MTIGLWDVETETLLSRLTGHGNFVFSIKSNARGDMIVRALNPVDEIPTLMRRSLGASTRLSGCGM